MTETQKKYYKKNAEKIKAVNKARYYEKKKKAREIYEVVARLDWEVTRIEKLANILAFTAAINAASLIFLAFFH